MASKKNQPKRPQQQQQGQHQDQQGANSNGALGGGVSLGGINGPGRRGSWRAGGPNAPSPSTTPQPTAPSSSSTPKTEVPPSQSSPKPKLDDAANLSSKSASLLGSKVVVTLCSSKKYEGTLAAADSSNKDATFGLLLRMVKEVGSPHDARTREMTFKGSDVLDISAAKEEGIPGISAKKDGFRTDTDISSRPNPSTFLPGRERVLEPWQPSPSDPSSSGLVSDADTFGDTSLSSGGPSNGKGWDQFAENEKRFGTRSDFDEEMYTTKLDRSGKDFREKERRAEMLASQIMGQSSSNPHIQEERGQKLEDSGLGEEDRYSGVIRNPNAYVPPGARNSASGPSPSTANFPPLSSTSSSRPSPSLAATIGKPKPSIPSPAATAPPTLPVPVSISNLSPGVGMTRSNSSIGPHANPSVKGELPAIAKETHQDGRPAPTVRLPPSGSGGAAPAGTIGTPGSEDGPATEKNVLSAFHEFVKNDRQRLEAKKIQVAQKAKNEKEKRLKELVKFGQDFKLKSTIPADLVPILAKDAEKQKAIVEKATADALLAASRPSPSPSSSKTSLPTNASLAASAAAPPTVAFANRRQLIAPASATKAGAADAGKGKMTIQDIPPFRPAAAGATEKGKEAAGGQAAAAAARLSVNAPAFVFKPNPAAAAFKPNKSPVREIPPHRSGLHPTASPKVLAAVPNSLLPQSIPSSSATAAAASISQSSTPQPQASTSQLPPNPFFGTKPPLKKSGIGSVNVRDDFNPFKLNKLGEASSYPPTWSFTGKPYRALFPPSPSPSLNSMASSSLHSSQSYPYPPPHPPNALNAHGSPYPPHHPMAQQHHHDGPGGPEGWGSSVDGYSQGPSSHLVSPQPGHAQPGGGAGGQPGGGGGYPGGMYGAQGQYYGAGAGRGGFGYGGPPSMGQPPMPGGPANGANGGYLHPVQTGGAYGGPHMFAGGNGMPPGMGGYPGYHPQYQGQVFPGAGGRAPMGYHQVQPGQMQSPQMGHGYPNQYQMHQQQQQHPPQTPQQGGGPPSFAPPPVTPTAGGGDAGEGH